MIFEGLTLAEYLAPRMRPVRAEKPKKQKKRSVVIEHYQAGEKLIVCAMLAKCCERYARRVISKHKKAAVG